MAIRTYIALAVGAGLLLAASAAIAGDPKTAGDTQAKPQQHSAAPKAGCLTQTGSRLPVNGACMATGHSYSQKDMRQTGATTVAQALPLLDPTITIRH